MNGVSALICTRNRAESLVRTVRSLLRPDGETFDLIIIDQSDGDDSERAVAPFRDDPRLRYIRYQAAGKGAALNYGLRVAMGDVVVCTDDDCEAPPHWVTHMADVMGAQPTAAVVFCNVTANPYDTTAGYVPAYERRTDRILRSVLDARTGLGLGAGMALRREAVLAIGGFDETLGPGSRFRSGDDWDISLRALLRGWHVYDTAATSVLHHGYRTMREGREHALRDWIAIGALCAKPIRVGNVSTVILALWIFSVQALWPPVRDVLRLRRPSGYSRIAGFARGFVEGLRMPVDRATLTFRIRVSSSTRDERSKGREPHGERVGAAESR